MKIVVVILYSILLSTIVLSAQHNYIFDGGTGNGFYAAHISTKNQNSIFFGSNSDGHSYLHEGFATTYWDGGIDDGMAYIMTSTKINSPLFSGGKEDGSDSKVVSTISQNSIFNGSNDDGFGAHQIMSTSNGFVFDGGLGDGFAQSGISNLIWDGDLNKDWNMADNWNLPMVPNISISAIIPGQVQKYPILNGIMGIGVSAKDYTCRSLYLLENAIINGNNAVQINLSHELHIWGLLNLNTSQNSIITTSPGAKLHIYENGSVILK